MHPISSGAYCGIWGKPIRQTAFALLRHHFGNSYDVTINLVLQILVSLYGKRSFSSTWSYWQFSCKLPGVLQPLKMFRVPHSDVSLQHWQGIVLLQSQSSQSDWKPPGQSPSIERITTTGPGTLLTPCRHFSTARRETMRLSAIFWLVIPNSACRVLNSVFVMFGYYRPLFGLSTAYYLCHPPGGIFNLSPFFHKLGTRTPQRYGRNGRMISFVFLFFYSLSS